ncbi:MAG TPA: hypothetical protein VF783_06970 [Terriglobales bacterium]
MSKASTSAMLIAAASSALGLTAGSTSTLAIAVAVATIAAATDEYLHPAAGAKEQAARSLHRRSSRNAEEDGERKIDGTPSGCDTAASRVPSSGLRGPSCGVRGGVAPV